MQSLISMQDNYPKAIEYLLYFFTNAYKENQEINLEVFIHKADARAEDYRNGMSIHLTEFAVMTIPLRERSEYPVTNI